MMVAPIQKDLGKRGFGTRFLLPILEDKQKTKTLLFPLTPFDTMQENWKIVVENGGINKRTYGSTYLEKLGQMKAFFKICLAHSIRQTKKQTLFDTGGCFLDMCHQNLRYLDSMATQDES